MARHSVGDINQRHRHHLQHGVRQAAANGGRHNPDVTRLRFPRHSNPALGLGATQQCQRRVYGIFGWWELGKYGVVNAHRSSVSGTRFYW